MYKARRLRRAGGGIGAGDKMYGRGLNGYERYLTRAGLPGIRWSRVNGRFYWICREMRCEGEFY